MKGGQQLETSAKTGLLDEAGDVIVAPRSDASLKHPFRDGGSESSTFRDFGRTSLRHLPLAQPEVEAS